ncbi:MAG: adenylate/guanylate cyclase domain-containing protein, partial [Candidatus Aegiribacteria sp.]
MNPLLPGNIRMVREGRSIFHGSLLFADISGFTELTGKLALHGKRGTEELCEILNSFFSSMYGIVKEHGGSVIYSAGDSLMVSFPSEAGTAGCAKAMMEGMEEFRRLRTIAGYFSLGIKTVLGYGSWGVFVVGDATVARLVLTGELVEKMALAEETAVRGETVSVTSSLPVSMPCHPSEPVPDSAFYIPGTENLQGEHRSISAIFLNVTGYDPAMPPVDRIRRLYTDVSGITMKYRGVVQMVDSVLAGGFRMFLLFGAPRSYGSDLLEGVQAGLDIISRLSGLEGLQVRMGMDSGYAFAGVIGNSWRKHYTVIGEVVNTAARIADSAEPGSFLISDRVYRMCRNDFVCIEKGDADLSGMDGTLRLFSPSRRRPDPVYSYRFAGRESETDEIMGRVLSGGCLTLIEGEAGIGKTRFLDRLRDLLVEMGFMVPAGSSSEHGQTDEILATLVADMAGILQSDTREVSKNRLRYLIHELDDSRGTLARREPFLGRMLFSIEYPESDYDRLPPKLRRENLVDGVCDLTGRMAGPVCVILENLHNCTDEDLKTVEYICRNVLGRSGSDVSFVLSRRPDDRVLFESGDPEAVKLTLGNLDEKARDQLMLEILEGSPLEGPLEELIVRRAGGNPFYLMQFLLYLREESLITLEDGVWTRTAAYSDNRLPESVFSMIMARIDRLEKQAKRSLRIGSVMGMRFDEEIVGRVAETDAGPGLSECSDAGLIYRSELRALEFVFSHTLIKDVTYDSILRKRRKSIHGAIGSILEEMYQHEPEPVCPVLAYHFQTAGKWDKALDYNIMAGEKAWSEYRNQNAVQHYLNAVKIMEEHQEGLPDRRAWCFRELGRVHDRLGDYDLALEYYDKALETSSDFEITADVSLMKAD